MGGADGVLIVPLFRFIGVFTTGNGAKFASKGEELLGIIEHR